MIKRFLKWWKQPSRYEKVQMMLDARPSCIEISFTYANGRVQRLTGQEATDYFRYLQFLYNGIQCELTQMRQREWKWQEKDK